MLNQMTSYLRGRSLDSADRDVAQHVLAMLSKKHFTASLDLGHNGTSWTRELELNRWSASVSIGLRLAWCIWRPEVDFAALARLINQEIDVLESYRLELVINAIKQSPTKPSVLHINVDEIQVTYDHFFPLWKERASASFVRELSKAMSQSSDDLLIVCSFSGTAPLDNLAFATATGYAVKEILVPPLEYSSVENIVRSFAPKTAHWQGSDWLKLPAFRKMLKCAFGGHPRALECLEEALQRIHQVPTVGLPMEAILQQAKNFAMEQFRLFAELNPLAVLAAVSAAPVQPTSRINKDSVDDLRRRGNYTVQSPSLSCSTFTLRCYST